MNLRNILNTLSTTGKHGYGKLKVSTQPQRGVYAYHLVLFLASLYSEDSTPLGELF